MDFMDLIENLFGYDQFGYGIPRDERLNDAIEWARAGDLERAGIFLEHEVINRLEARLAGVYILEAIVAIASHKFLLAQQCLGKADVLNQTFRTISRSSDIPALVEDALKRARSLVCKQQSRLYW